MKMTIVTMTSSVLQLGLTVVRPFFLRVGIDSHDPVTRKMIHSIPYSGKVWRGESLANLANRRRFAKLKPSKLIPTIDNPMADLFIRQTFFRQTLKNSRFAKHSARQTFPLYGNAQFTLSIPLIEQSSTIFVTVILENIANKISLDP